ncbi:hypothetical protein HD806DRAFT_527308 [Xylariaceae sp. AK1471]|nr:hypothetical protein HD806DRAFT_527308 [Xylariaceae sp. AK1471]
MWAVISSLFSLFWTMLRWTVRIPTDTGVCYPQPSRPQHVMTSYHQVLEENGWRLSTWNEDVAKMLRDVRPAPDQQRREESEKRQEYGRYDSKAIQTDRAREGLYLSYGFVRFMGSYDLGGEGGEEANGPTLNTEELNRDGTKLIADYVQLGKNATEAIKVVRDNAVELRERLKFLRPHCHLGCLAKRLAFLRFSDCLWHRLSVEYWGRLDLSMCSPSSSLSSLPPVSQTSTLTSPAILDKVNRTRSCIADPYLEVQSLLEYLVNAYNTNYPVPMDRLTTRQSTAADNPQNQINRRKEVLILLGVDKNVAKRRFKDLVAKHKKRQDPDTHYQSHSYSRYGIHSRHDLDEIDNIRSTIAQITLLETVLKRRIPKQTKVLTITAGDVSSAPSWVHTAEELIMQMKMQRLGKEEEQNQDQREGDTGRYQENDGGYRHGHDDIGSDSGGSERGGIRELEFDTPQAWTINGSKFFASLAEVEVLALVAEIWAEQVEWAQVAKKALGHGFSRDESSEEE